MYEPQELKAIMEETDKKYGNFPETKLEENRLKRIHRLANLDKKSHAIIEKLQLWGLPFTLCEVIRSKKQKHKITTDLFIPNANIVIRQVNMSDDIERSKAKCFYHFMKANFHVFFVRSTETEDFVLMKLHNCIMKANECPAKGFNGVKQDKPKRKRIQANRVVKVINKYKY